MLRVRRVAVTRDEAPDGPLATALRAHGLEPLTCAVLVEAPPHDPQPLLHAARRLETFTWVLASSVRGVTAVTRARGRSWPARLQTGAVGAATARALTDAGVTGPVMLGDGDGAELLWQTLSELRTWRDVPVLVVSTPGGRPTLADRLREAGALVTVVDAYRMEPRPADAIARDWAAAGADAVVLASPRVANTLAAAVGVDALSQCRVVAIGATTSQALATLGLPHDTAGRASFEAIAALLAAPAAAPRAVAAALVTAPVVTPAVGAPVAGEPLP